MPLALGRLSHDAAALALAPQLGHYAATWGAPPPQLDRNNIAYAPKLYGNDTLPDCTAAGLANAADAQAALNGLGAVAIDEQHVVDFYADCVGCTVPAQLAATAGARELDVLSYQARKGFDVGLPAPLVADCATFDPRNRGLLANAMAHLGSGYLGVALAIADQATYGANGLWDTDTPAADGDPTPGSWGLHCLVCWSYSGLGDTDVVTLATWGALQRATWRWVASRIEEAHAVIFRDLVGADQPFGGLAYDDLKGASLAWAV
jgi:hypothetical protein